MSSSDGISSFFQAQQSQVQAQIGVAVIRKSLDATQVQGDAMVELIQAASDIAKELGKGVQFDARA